MVKKKSEFLIKGENTMGAHDISFELTGKATQTQIDIAFKNKVKEDAYNNGHAGGYSGDFQTLDKVDYSHLGRVFGTYEEAYRYALEKSEKWTTAVAVYYAVSVNITNKTIDKNKSKIAELSKQFLIIDDTPLAEGKLFKTCSHCKSKLAISHLGYRKTCPMCNTDLRSKSVANKLAKLNAKIIALKEKNEKVVAKANLKAGNINTIVVGWGAC